MRAFSGNDGHRADGDAAGGVERVGDRPATWQKAQAAIEDTPEERRAFEAWLALATNIERGESVADGGGQARSQPP
ncbi:MAG: hypothetical protein HY901_33215 [Deltaproteobacteria bacterium]|nr:hypothetical protein [Deltaproteobacteria bacterium]